MNAFIRRNFGQTDEEGWAIKLKYFVYHPFDYGIATLMRIGFRTGPGGWQILLHHFKPHSENEFHDHPWGFRTIVLKGEYIDESIGSNGRIINELMRPGRTRVRRALHAHRTSCEVDTWTIVFVRPKSRDWCKGKPGHWTCDGKVEDFDSLRGMVKVKSD